MIRLALGIFMVTVFSGTLLLPVLNNAQAADKIRIGIIGPLQIRPGIAMKQGAIMAADEINDL